VAESAKAAAMFAAKARELGAVATRVIATSAARDAVNPEDLLTAIEQAAGLKVEIISGEQEADWAFQGVNTDPELRLHPLLLMDLGGGSTEFILGQGQQKHFRRSFRLGTVRLLEKMPPDDPPTAGQLAACRQFVREFLEREVRAALEPALAEQRKSHTPQRGLQLVGTGGTATILARMEGRLAAYERHLIEAQRISAAQVRAHVEGLWSLPLAERKKIVGLPKSRADVILSGVVIYEGVMDCFGFGELRISTRGLRFAAVG
jgi:exopolyphosphatase/guanosine-5'-triphosphate,3'-diphosphate pyrophosphatase